MTTPHESAAADQEAARIRQWRDNALPGGGFARLDRAEMEALVERGASPEEVRAWLAEQVRKAEAEREALAALESERGDGTPEV